jgi:glycosyltransferase involved in cell wall biosynthesis
MTPRAGDSGLCVALVHDYLLVMRGAERTFATLASCWPDAPIHTLLHDPAAIGDRLAGHEVRPSHMQLLRLKQRSFRRMLPLYPIAAERLPIAGHSVVVSSSSAFAHGVRPDDGAVHVCYCHSPFRYAWHELPRALDEVAPPLRPVVRQMLLRIRSWDANASRRVTHYIANSTLTQERIERFYNRSSVVVYPPVEVDRFRPAEPEDFLLIVTELVRHKQVDVALRAARTARRRVKVVGEGPELDPLRAAYGDMAEFLGRISDRELARLYSRAAALVVPNVEEFGIAAVEAQAAGRPVVAPAAGGTAETIIDGETGVLVPPGDGVALAEAIAQTDFNRFVPGRLVENAARFSPERFRRQIVELTRRWTGVDGMVSSR